ncbi:MAG: hypothetical protein F6K24_15355 [Okeania sp. SIO2D1]|nr:hypothetical protein [Okeania sp. SIO2D1]
MKKEEGRRKKEEGRRKKAEGRRKKAEGRRENCMGYSLRQATFFIIFFMGLIPHSLHGVRALLGVRIPM